MAEPYIQIGKYVLAESQAMAVRVAISQFYMEVSSEEGREDLGPIADGYRDRLAEVLKIIFAETSPDYGKHHERKDRDDGF